MNKVKTTTMALLMMTAVPAAAQFNLGKAASGALKSVQAITLSDEEMMGYAKESVRWMDEHNPVCAEDDPYTVRLRHLTEGLTDVEGIPLNFKVYRVIDVNAFACPDGSVRVFSSLMDIMTDDELRGVIGHEIGHVALKHSKKAFRTALMAGAAKDLAASANGRVAALTDSQLGELSESLINAQFSQKQESESDDYGYEYLKRCGKNPWAIALAFERLQQLEQEAGTGSQSKMQKMLSTHPDLQKRITKMSKRAQKDVIARPDNQ